MIKRKKKIRKIIEVFSGFGERLFSPGFGERICTRHFPCEAHHTASRVSRLTTTNFRPEGVRRRSQPLRASACTSKPPANSSSSLGFCGGGAFPQSENPHTGVFLESSVATPTGSTLSNGASGALIRFRTPCLSTCLPFTIMKHFPVRGDGFCADVALVRTSLSPR